MNEWKKMPLEKAIDFNPSESIEKGAYAPKIPMGNLIEHERKIDGFEIHQYKSGPKFRNGDTLLAKITPCLENGKTAQVDILDDDEVAFGSSEFIVLRSTKHTTPDYVYYLAISPTFRKKAIVCMEGTSGRKRVRKRSLKKFKLPFPMPTEQGRIANVLKSLDAKIELNKKINSELEAMAKLIYDYWFVQFDFPDKKGNPYKSSGGAMVYIEELNREIPKGWRSGTIMDCADLIGGGTPNKNNSEYWSGEIPFFTPSDTEDNIYCFKTELYTNMLGISNSSTKLFDKDTVFITARGSVGKINIAGTQMAMNQSCYALSPKDHYSSEFIYFHTGMMVDFLKVKSSGSTFNSIVTNDFEFTEVVIPKKGTINRFTKLINPFFEKIWSNKKENEKLKKLRDWLLPMLMNGQVRVKEKDELGKVADSDIDNNDNKKPTNVDYYKRIVLAAEIVWQLHKQPTLGHLKLQKLIYLAQQSNGMSLPTNFLKQAAGPYDPRMARSIDKQLKKKNWFEYNENEFYNYKSLENAGEHREDFDKYFSEEKEDIQYLINTFKKAKSDSVEIVATLYACWVELLENDEHFSEELLIKKFYKWSEEKAKYEEERLKKAISWMREKGIIPAQELEMVS